MLTLHTERKIKIFPVEKPTMWLFYACVVEVQGDEIILVSEPKLVKVQKKEVALLPGCVSCNKPLLITAPIKTTAVPNSIVSPYFSYEVNREPLFSIWHNARPPTVTA